MADPFVSLGRVLMLVGVPLMLIFPLVFAACVPNRASLHAARAAIRGKMLLLVLTTGLLLAGFVGLVLAGLRFADAMTIAGFWWVWALPLWFLLAWPAVALKRPHWGSGDAGPGSPVGASPSDGASQSEHATRSASLTNRERQSPVTRSMWAIAIFVFVLALGIIAARGLFPFATGETHVAAATSNDVVAAAQGSADSSEPGIAARAERSRWLWMLVVYGGVFLLLLLSLPMSLRRTLTEPEPMDSMGSNELAVLYATQRRRRVLGLFWGSGVLLPAVLGLILALITWFPNNQSLWGLIGGIGGMLLGIGGATFAIWMTSERAKIVEMRGRLQHSAMSRDGQPSAC